MAGLTMSPFWLKWRVWIMGAVVVIALTMLVVTLRRNAVWKEQARVADSTAKVTQKDRARNDKEIAAAKALAESLGFAVTRLTKRADSVAALARQAVRDAERVKVQRDAAITSLRGAQTQADSLTALVRKSAADDEVIARQNESLVAKEQEATALRQALDSSSVARSRLLVAIDSARAQLARDAVVIQSLQSVVRSARPTSGPRFTKLAISAGVGYCASPDLTHKVCGAVVAGPSLRLF